MSSATAMLFDYLLSCGSGGFFLLADRIEDADETALVACEHGHQTVKRALERPNQTAKKLDFRGEGSELGNALRIDDLAVDVRRFDFDGLVGLAEGQFERFRGRDRIVAGENDGRRTGQVGFKFRCEIAARGA